MEIVKTNILSKPEQYWQNSKESFLKKFPNARFSDPVVKDAFLKGICEEKLFFFAYRIMNGFQVMDVDYHWEMCEYLEDTPWCKKCEFKSYHYDKTTSKLNMMCTFHDKPTQPFSSCEEQGVVQVRKMLQEARESLKSTVATIAMPTWSLAIDIDFTNLLGHAVSEKSEEFLASISEHCETNKDLRRLWPHLRIENATENNKEKLRFPKTRPGGHEPQLMAIGLDRSFEGGHYWRLTLDDLSGKKNMASDTSKQTAYDRYCALAPLARQEFPQFIMPSTTWAEDDITGRTLNSPEGGQWEHRRTEMFYAVINPDLPPDDLDNQKQYSLDELEAFVVEGIKRKKKGISLKGILGDFYAPYKSKWTERVIIEKLITELHREPFFFMCQYFNRAEGNAADEIKEEWIKYTLKPKYPAELMYWHIHMDLAPGSNTAKTSSVGIGVVARDCDRNFYLFESIHKKFTVEKACDKMYELDAKYKPKFFTSEKGKDLLYWTQFLDQYHKLKVKNLQDSDNPEDRELAKTIKKPKIVGIPRAGANENSKRNRILKSLQGPYEQGRFYHIGEKDDHEHKPYEKRLLKIKTWPIHDIDVNDGVADSGYIPNFPNKMWVESQMRLMNVPAMSTDLNTIHANETLQKAIKQISINENNVNQESYFYQNYR